MENNIYLDKDELTFLEDYIDGKLLDLSRSDYESYNLEKGFYRYLWVKLNGAIEKIRDKDSCGTVQALQKFICCDSRSTQKNERKAQNFRVYRVFAKGMEEVDIIHQQHVQNEKSQALPRCSLNRNSTQ